jgi:uncharacterized protein
MRFFFLFIAAMALLIGCAHYATQLKLVTTQYDHGDFAEALVSLEKTELKTEKNNRLLYYLEKAMILDRIGQREDSRDLLFRADNLAKKLYTVSFTKTAATFVMNESVADYEGEDYEKISIHTMLALSFVEDKKLKSARVEAKRINSLLNQINENYGPDEPHRFQKDGFARYLAGLIYESLGEVDNAIISYRTALKIYENLYAKLFEITPPKQLVTALQRLLTKRRRTSTLKKLQKKYNLQPRTPKSLNSGELVVIHELGSVTPKTTTDALINVGNQTIRLSFPLIIPKYSNPGPSKVTIKNKKKFAETFQNMDAIAVVSLEDRKQRLILKQGTRLLVKSQLIQKAYEELGPLGGILTNIAAAATETADTRSWTSLPQKFAVSRLEVAAGSHDVIVTTNGHSFAIKGLKIRPGETKIIRKPIRQSHSHNLVNSSHL